MSARLVDRCGVCGHDNLESVLHLGSSPPTCAMQPIGKPAASVEHHPLELLRCPQCTLVQLSVVVDAEEMFPPGYPYSSGNSRALHENFEELVHAADRWAGGGLERNDLVVDIGANDGTLLSKFDCRTVGVEPTRQILKGDTAAYNEFFTAELAHRILEDHGYAKVITACNVLAHVEDIDEVMRGIDILLADDGLLVAENHDLQSVVVGGQWDTVYHEHLRFFDPCSFKALLDRHGFLRMDSEAIPTHGGSFRTVAQKGPYGVALDAPPQRDYPFTALQADAAEARREIRKATEEPVWAIGATARATTIINYCGLDVEDIECVCEVAGSDKIGHYIPGTRIPVVDEQALFDEQPDRVLLLSWHLADVIVPKLREKGFDGEVIVPLPELAAA